METIHVQFDELTEPMAPVHLSTGPASIFLTPGQISSGLIPNPIHAAPCVPPTNKDLEILFQPMFDEYLEPPRIERPVSLAPAVQVPVNSVGTPSFTTIDHDAPVGNKMHKAFPLPAKHSSGNEDGNTACVPTASTNVPTANASVATISQDTACAYITSQSSGSQIKFEDINQIDEDDVEEMDIKWNMALLSMRADKECEAPRSQDRGRRDNFRQGSKAKEQAPKDLMAIDGVGWDWSYMANDGKDHALVTDEEAPTEF
nr:hypothetical protein [Tanacetum cinerariifolium]